MTFVLSRCKLACREQINYRNYSAAAPRGFNSSNMVHGGRCLVGDMAKLVNVTRTRIKQIKSSPALVITT